MTLLARLLLFLAGAYVSFDRCAEHWVVGPVFGTVVLLWHPAGVRGALTPKSLGFLASSTLIYALVYEISRRKMPEIPYLFNSLMLAVLVGTVLLALAHEWWLGASRRRVKIAIPAVYAAFYLSHFLSLPDGVEKWVNMVSIWQAAYLFCFFGPEVRATTRSR